MISLFLDIFFNLFFHTFVIWSISHMPRQSDTPYDIHRDACHLIFQRQIDQATHVTLHSIFIHHTICHWHDEDWQTVIPRTRDTLHRVCECRTQPPNNAWRRVPWRGIVNKTHTAMESSRETFELQKNPNVPLTSNSRPQYLFWLGTQLPGTYPECRTKYTSLRLSCHIVISTLVRVCGGDHTITYHTWGR